MKVSGQFQLKKFNSCSEEIISSKCSPRLWAFDFLNAHIYKHSACAVAAVVHSCVRGVPCHSEGELLCPGGAGAWQDLQGVGDGCQLHRLLSAQRETRLQNWLVHTLELKSQHWNKFVVCHFVISYCYCEGRLNGWVSIVTIVQWSFLLKCSVYIFGGPERMHFCLLIACCLSGSSISTSDWYRALHCHVGFSHVAVELRKTGSRTELHLGVLPPVRTGGRGAEVGVKSMDKTHRKNHSTL